MFVRRRASRRHLYDMTGIVLTDVTAMESVVRRAAAGDEDACATLVVEYHADMVRAAYVITRDADGARDATQLAWSKAWQRIGSLHRPERVRSWLVAIAANEARQQLRGQRRRVIREIAFERAQPPDPSDLIEVLDLRQAVSRLSPDDRVLLALRYVGGLESEEIGRYLGLSPSGVRSRLGRLLDRLRKDLDHA
jgi:RNA polymerase sigma factor (sigma-70 family)